VESEGDLSPWILASAGVLHNSCTSGIQAAASDIPVIAFGDQAEDLEGEASIPNKVSIPAVGMDSVMAAVANLDLQWNRVSVRSRAIVNEKLTGVGTAGPLQGTADALISLSGKPCPTGNGELGRDSIVYDIRELYRTSPLRRQTRRTVLDQRKRPTIPRTQIKRDVDRIARLLQCRRELSVRRVAPNTYCIRRAVT
jgi:hypothetical protein